MGNSGSKMNPDELAEAVRKLVEDNGAALSGLSFSTRAGDHSYRAIKKMSLKTGLPVSVLVPAD